MEAKFFRMLLMISCALVILSCDNDSDDNTVLIDSTEISSALVDGPWKVSYYFDDKDETSDYNGYSFTFEGDGDLLATNGDISITGSWSIADSDSNDNSTDGSLEFNIFFASPAIFEELTDDWDIMTFTNGKIELKDVSGGDGTTDFLTLEKM